MLMAGFVGGTHPVLAQGRRPLLADLTRRRTDPGRSLVVMEERRCRECGATSRLTADGVCEWRTGCEHRQMQAEAIMSAITVEIEQVTPEAEEPVVTERIVFASSPDDLDVLDAAYEHALDRWEPGTCLHCEARLN